MLYLYTFPRELVFERRRVRTFSPTVDVVYIYVKPKHDAYNIVPTHIYPPAVYSNSFKHDVPKLYIVAVEI